jgi:hypothetical protein
VFSTSPSRCPIVKLGYRDVIDVALWRDRLAGRSCAAVAGTADVLANDLIRDDLQTTPGSRSRGRAATLVDAHLAAGADEQRQPAARLTDGSSRDRAIVSAAVAGLLFQAWSTSA